MTVLSDRPLLLIQMDIAGHLPGPNGQRISEADENDPDKLVVPVNDNYDERRQSNGMLESDNDDKDSGNVMSDPQLTESTQIRKDDWRAVNF